MKGTTGFSFIEVLISLFLLGIVLLGYEVLQMQALRRSYSAYYLGVAADQVTSMVERLKARKTLNGLASQIDIWNRQNLEVLPQAEGKVGGRYPNFTVELKWGSRKGVCNDPDATCLQQKVVLQ